MTKTALRALTVAALSAATILTTSQVALADQQGCGFADENVPGGWVATDCFENDPEGQAIEPAPQLESERIGRQLDINGQLCTITAVNPDVLRCVDIPEEAPASPALGQPNTALAQQAPRASAGATPTLAAEAPQASTPVDTVPAPAVDVTAPAPAAVAAAVIDWVGIGAWISSALAVAV